MDRDYLEPARGVLRIILIALVTGSVSASAVFLFDLSLDAVYRLTAAPIGTSRLLIPVAGALAVGLLILRKVPEAGGEGIPSYIASVDFAEGRMDLAATILKFPATVITLGFLGSGGTVGPLARIGGGLGSLLTGVTRLSPAEGPGAGMRTGAVCGVSGAVAAIFHSPLGGALFAAEILRRESMRYSDLFSALLSGSVSYSVYSFVLGGEPFFLFPSPAPALSGYDAIWLPFVAILAGATGMVFIFSYERAWAAFRHMRGGRPSRALAAGLLLSAALWLSGGWAHGISREYAARLSAGDFSGPSSFPFFETDIVMALLVFIALKILLTTVTVGSGLSGGFTGPLLLIGASAGAMTALMAGAPAGSSTYYSLMACGISATLSATLNIPLGAIVLTMSLFGSNYVLPAAAGGSIAFLIFKNRTVYRYYGG